MFSMQKMIDRYHKYAKGGQTNNTAGEQNLQVDLYLEIKIYIYIYSHCDVIKEKIVGMHTKQSFDKFLTFAINIRRNTIWLKFVSTWFICGSFVYKMLK
jgi:hypothetical protein